MRFLLKRRSLLQIGILALGALTACDSPSNPGAEVGPPASLQLLSGDLQSAPPGAELPQPLVVRVLDAAGHPVPGYLVNFRVVAGGGSVFAGAAQTNAQGEARERWTVGTVAGDTQRVEARVVDATTGAPLVLGVFRAMVTAGAPVAFESVPNLYRGEGLVTRAIPAPLEVIVLDAQRNRVPGVSVTWTGSGTFNPAVSVSDAQGRASTIWTLGTASGMQTATATAGPATVTLSAFASTSPEIPGRLVLSAESPVSVQVEDSARVPAALWQDVYGNSGDIYPQDPALQWRSEDPRTVRMSREQTPPIPQAWHYQGMTIGTVRLIASIPTPRGPAADTLVMTVTPSAAYTFVQSHFPRPRAAAGTASDFWVAGGELEGSEFRISGTMGRIVDGTARATAQVTRLPLYGIWAPASTLMFAAGSDGVMLRWNGAGWAREESGTTSDLYSLHGGSATNLWAGGEGGTLRHFTGGAWNAANSPTSEPIRSLWVAPSGEVFLAAGSTVYRGGASGWQAYPLSGVVTSLQGASASDVAAVAAGRVWRFDGSSWVQLPAYTYAPHTGGTAPSVIRAAASTGGSVYAISEELCSGVSDRCYNLLRWDGASWTFLSRQGGQAGGAASDVRLIRLRDGSLAYILQRLRPVLVVDAPAASPSRARARVR